MPRRLRLHYPDAIDHLLARGNGRQNIVCDDVDRDRLTHLNSVRAGMVEHPAAWAWSSYRGYAHRGRRLEWVAYDELLASWGGEFGGQDQAGADGQYVTAGLSEPPESPWKEATRDGSSGVEHSSIESGRWCAASRAGNRDWCRVFPCHQYVRSSVPLHEIEPTEPRHRGCRHPARAALAYLARSAADSVDQCGAGGNARGLECGQRPQPDSAFRRLVSHRCKRPRAVEMPR